MRYITALLAAAFLCLPALAQESYTVTATMPVTTGNPAGCVLYVNGAPVGGTRACGTPTSYTGFAAGTYEFRYLLEKADGSVTALSPATVVSIAEDVSDPTEPPGITVACADAGGNSVPCPAHISISIAP